MSEKLPYEDAFEKRMNSLPSPDAETSWQKMKQLLEEKEKRKPLGFFRRFAPFTIIAIILLIIGWYLVHAPNNDKDSLPVAQTNALSKNPIEKNDDGTMQPQIKEPVIADKTSHTNTENEVRDNKETARPLSKDEDKITVAVSTSKTAKYAGSKTTTSESHKSGKYANNKKTKSKNGKTGNSITVKNNEVKNSTASPTKETGNKTSPATKIDYNKLRDTGSAIVQTIDDTTSIGTQTKSETLKLTEESKDSSSLIKGDDLKQPVIESKKQKNNTNKKYVVGLGVGVQQQIALNGQKNVSIGYNGKSSLADYIPSIYLHFERKKKWYLQTEFIYAAPQLVNNFSYFRETASDSASQKTTSYTLNKTYYTDIPLTFNYYIKPNWSLGVGGMYGWLHGAVAEKETNSRNLQTQQSVTVKETKLINGFTDSFLYKSHTYLLLQSDYRLKNVSLGFRYSRDMQPYIKYTLPNGVIEDRRNWSLEFILRMQLLQF